METIEETLKISIIYAHYPTKSVLFSSWLSEDEKPAFGLAACEEDKTPMWTFSGQCFPEVHPATREALKGPHFQDFFSLLFMQYHEFGIGTLYVNNECGNISFSVKPN